jgi:predicted TIM-barrel fold metal-dependent hydrolase
MLLVDCDVHPGRDQEAIQERLPDHFQAKGPADIGFMWTNPTGGARRDDVESEPDDPASLVADHVEANDIDYCLLNDGSIWLGVHPNADLATATAAAYNDYLIEEWLQYDERLYGSMLVAKQDPEAAAAEIRRVGDHPKICQVLTASGTRAPYGKRRYWPIYEAAEEMDLPVAIHPATEGNGTSNPPTGAGYPSTYFEWHTLLSANYMGQLVSLVSEGVFAEYPTLQWVFVEGGVTWVPHFLWRMDKNWKGLRSDVPWLERPPSEYVTDHVKFTTQPIAEPDDPSDLQRLLELVDADRTVMFASDYPHWDNDDPERGIPPLDDALERQIFGETAAELYGFD